MNKEEILSKAQAEKNDEREKQVSVFSFRWTYLTMGIVASVFAYFRAMKGQPITDLCATVCYSVCAGMIYRYTKTKNISDLLFAAITFAIACVATLRFFMGR